MTNNFTLLSDLMKMEILKKFDAPKNEHEVELNMAYKQFKFANLYDSHLCRLRGRQHLLNAIKTAPDNMKPILQMLVA